MRIWIQPLPADRYNLKHEMTLNDFLALIGILNDPSKQAIYTNPLTGATYILNIFDGNMPLVEVLDLIGYDRNNLEQQFLGNAHRIQVIDTTTILQLQDDTTAIFHPEVSEEIFYRHGVTDYQRSHFSQKVLDAFDIVKLRFQDSFRETIYESAYNIIKTKYSEDFGITQEEWLELVDSKAKDENGAFTQEFEKIVDLCLKEQIFLNLIELSSAQDQDVDAIFSTLDTYLDENFGSLIEQLFDPLTFEAFISEVINQVLNNIDNEGFVTFSVPTQEYFEDLISVQDSYKDELVSVYWGSPPPPEFKKATFIESNYKTELDDLSQLFYRIKEYLIDQNNKDLPITDTLLGLHGPKDPGTYTKHHLTNVLKVLGLNDEKMLQDMLLNQKAFYKTLLEKIQYDIQNNPNSAFKDYSKALSGEIGFGKYLTEQELELVKRLDDVLNEVLGYVGYTLLKLGFITFDGNEQIEFKMPQDLTTLAKIIRVLGLDSIAELKTSKMSIMEYLETLIWSMILSGHYMNLRTLDNNGQIKIRKEYTYPGSHFLSGIFKNFMGNIPDSIYHLAIWNVITNAFLEKRDIRININSFEYLFKTELLSILTEGILNLNGDYDNLVNNAFEFLFDIPGERIDDRSKLMQWFVAARKDGETVDIYRKVASILGISDNNIFDGNNLDNNQITRIMDAIRDYLEEPNWNPNGKNRNIGFLKFEIKLKNGKIQQGFIFTRSGMQFMPGISYNSEDYSIALNMKAEVNDEYFAPSKGAIPTWYDSERKLLISLETLFQLSDVVEIKIELASELPFCQRSCRGLIDYFKSKYGDKITEFIEYDGVR
jgi:hypothetical protein